MSKRIVFSRIDKPQEVDFSSLKSERNDSEFSDDTERVFWVSDMVEETGQHYGNTARYRPIA
jgi:hypothetical protein